MFCQRRSVFESLVLQASNQRVSAFVHLPPSGSARAYSRAFTPKGSYLCCYSENVPENYRFLRLAYLLGTARVRVPCVYGWSACGKYLLLEDLGDFSLFDFVCQVKVSENAVFLLYAAVLDELFSLQFADSAFLCQNLPVFNAQSMLRDLLSFRCSFLHVLGVAVNDDAFYKDSCALVDCLAQVPAGFFVYRDLQSSNILLPQGELAYIDFQSAFVGPFYYDVASLLYDAKARLSKRLRDKLLLYYARKLPDSLKTSSDAFFTFFYLFVLIRVLQALGAFALRGFYEKKPLFLASVSPAIGDLRELLPRVREACAAVRLSIVSLLDSLEKLVALPCFVTRVQAEKRCRELEVQILAVSARESLEDYDLLLDCRPVELAVQGHCVFCVEGAFADCPLVKGFLKGFYAVLEELCMASVTRNALRVGCVSEGRELVAHCVQALSDYVRERFRRNAL